MGHVIPQVALQRIIQEGVAIVKDNIDVLDDIFLYYRSSDMNADYGQKYINQIKKWFQETKIPVVQAWSLNMSQVPQISVQLAQENEAEDKAAMGDYWGPGEHETVGVSVFNVTLDILILGLRNTDEVLWLYYIVNYILFKRKRQAERLGLQLQTFSVSDYSRDIPRIPENIWVRTIKFRTLVENYWDQQPYLDISDIEFCIEAEAKGQEPVQIEGPVNYDGPVN